MCVFHLYFQFFNYQIKFILLFLLRSILLAIINCVFFHCHLHSYKFVSFFSVFVVVYFSINVCVIFLISFLLLFSFFIYFGRNHKSRNMNTKWIREHHIPKKKFILSYIFICISLNFSF